jgi:hypothetical protein
MDFAPMRTKLCLLCLVVLLFTLAACGTTTNTTTVVTGSGNLISESRDVQGFKEIELAGSGNVNLTQGDSESVTIEAEDNLMPLLTTEVRGQRLVLGIVPNTSIKPTKLITYTITAKDVSQLVVSGSGTIVQPRIQTDDLKVEISGSGNITLSGSVETQDIILSGSGVYDADEVESNAAFVTISGSGNALLNVQNTLDVTISGSGAVVYSGQPTITENITGLGVLKPK